MSLFMTITVAFCLQQSAANISVKTAAETKPSSRYVIMTKEEKPVSNGEKIYRAAMFFFRTWSFNDKYRRSLH